MQGVLYITRCYISCRQIPDVRVKGWNFGEISLVLDAMVTVRVSIGLIFAINHLPG